MQTAFTGSPYKTNLNAQKVKEMIKEFAYYLNVVFCRRWTF